MADGDPAVEPELDGFSRVLPLPYRVALIIVMGMRLLSLLSIFTFSHTILTHLNWQESGHGVLTSTTSPSSKSTCPA